MFRQENRVLDSFVAMQIAQSSIMRNDVDQRVLDTWTWCHLPRPWNRGGRGTISHASFLTSNALSNSLLQPALEASNARTTSCKHRVQLFQESTTTTEYALLKQTGLSLDTDCGFAFICFIDINSWVASACIYHKYKSTLLTVRRVCIQEKLPSTCWQVDDSRMNFTKGEKEFSLPSYL